MSFRRPWQEGSGLKMPSEPLCAYCRQHPVDPEWRPFCSERCRMADLGHWISGDYRVAGDPPPSGDSEGPQDDEIDEDPT